MSKWPNWWNGNNTERGTCKHAAWGMAPVGSMSVSFYMCEVHNQPIEIDGQCYQGRPKEKRDPVEVMDELNGEPPLPRTPPARRRVKKP